MFGSGLLFVASSVLFSFPTPPPRPRPPPRPPPPFARRPQPRPRPRDCVDGPLGTEVFTGFRAGRVSIPSGRPGRGAVGVTTFDDRVAGVAVDGGGVATEDEGTGVEVGGGMDTAPINDAMMAVAAKLLCGDVAGGVG